MGELLDIIGEQVAGIVQHPLVVFGIQAVVAYLCILWLASAFWVFRDLHGRTRDPISPYLAAGAVVLFTPLFFPLAVLAYRVMRPACTLAERRTLELETELLSRQVSATGCPSCRRPIDESWSRCPGCGTRVGDECPACGERVGLDWAVCGWCAHDFEQPAPGDALPVTAPGATNADPAGPPRLPHRTDPVPVRPGLPAALPTAPRR